MKTLRIVLTIIAIILLDFIHPEGLMAAAEEGDGYVALLDSAENLLEDDPETAAGLVRDALGKINEMKDPVSASRAYFLLGEASYFSDDNAQAIVFYQKAAAINVAYGNDRTPRHIAILGNLGFSYDSEDQKSIALEYYQQALAIAREIGDTAEIAANLANIGQLMTIQGNYAKAIDYMEEALAIDRAQGDETIIATDLNTISRIYESWGMYERAVEYLEEALEIDTRLGNANKISIRYNSLGLIYKSWKKYDLALEAFSKALEIDRSQENAEKAAVREGNIGSTYLAMGQAEDAIVYLKRSHDYFRAAEMPSYLASNLNDLGRAYFMVKDYGEAEKALKECLEISLEENFNTWAMSSLATLSELYAETGRDRESLAAFRQFTALKDSVFNLESQRKIAEFQVKYDLFKKQQENELLVRDQEIARKRHTLVILGFSLSGLFLVLVLSVLVIRLKMQQNRRLITQRENERLQSDLEQRNKELTYKAMCIIKNNETVARMVDTLEQSIGTNDNHHKIRHLIYDLQHMEQANSWKEFEVHFVETHQEFYDNLQSRFPDLTPNEKKLCAFLRLNMSSKDIAAITHQSVHSINVARTRLRRKLGIDGTDENLGNFLAQL